MIDGEPWIIEDKDVVDIYCCDCGLVHLIAVLIEGKKVTLKHYRDTYATNARRKEKKIVVYRRK